MVALLATMGAKTSFMPVRPPRGISPVAIPVLALSTKSAMAVEAAKESGQLMIDTGQLSTISAIFGPFVTAVMALLGFSFGALYVGIKGDVNEVKDTSKDLSARVSELTGRVNELTGRVNELTGRVNELTGRVSGSIFLTILLAVVFGYPALKP